MSASEGKNQRLSVNLSVPTPNDTRKQISPHKSPNNLDGPNGVVGLGILAALDDDHQHHNHDQDPVFINSSRTAISPKSLSDPITIPNKSNLSKDDGGVEAMELCEEYTCVISHVGENFVKKREYFEAEILESNNGSQRISVVTGNGAHSRPVSDYSLDCGGGGGGEIATFGTADFLSSCFLCQKMLHGLDIFMYRGEKAFCSAECRYKQISIDEQNEKCHSGAKKPKQEYSISPCSGTIQFVAGVVAA